jgi:hypothetical protein
MNWLTASFQWLLYNHMAVLGLNTEDIDLKNGTITIYRSKTGDTQTHRLKKHARLAAETYLALCSPTTAAIVSPAMASTTVCASLESNPTSITSPCTTCALTGPMMHWVIARLLTVYRRAAIGSFLPWCSSTQSVLGLPTRV